LQRCLQQRPGKPFHLDPRKRGEFLGGVREGIHETSLFAPAQRESPLAGEFYPFFSARDLINLPNYHIYLKLMIDGVVSQPFSAV
jgi:hypothetical protein